MSYIATMATERFLTLLKQQESPMGGGLLALPLEITMVMDSSTCWSRITWTLNSAIFLGLVPARRASFAALTCNVVRADLKVRGIASFATTATGHSRMSLNKRALSTRTATMGWEWSGPISTTEVASMLSSPTTRHQISFIAMNFQTNSPKSGWSRERA